MQKAVASPPGPSSRLPLSNLWSLRRDLVGFFGDCCRRYGDVVRVGIGPREVYFLNHPDLIRDVLVTHQKNFIKSRGLQMSKKLLGEGLLTSEGEFHRRQRRLAQPAFHRQRLAAYSEAMVAAALEVSGRWEAGKTLDFYQEMMKLTLIVVGRTLFGSDVGDVTDQVGRALTEAMGLFSRVTLPFGEWLDKLPLPSNRRFQRAVGTLDSIVYRMIREHRRDGRDRGDLLSMLLLAQDEEGDGRGMTDRQVRDEAMTIFLAGHETTAVALSWTWCLLAKHPEALKRLQAEIDQVVGRREATFEDASKLVYTRSVLAESMRLYPPAYVIGRQAVEDYPVRDYLIPAGSALLMSQFVMHRDPRFFSDPTAFDPDRWTPEREAERPKFSYFPFGGGARVCIGESFAWLEGILTLATLARRWNPKLASDQPVRYQQTMTLRLKNGLPVKLEPRGPALNHPESTS